MKGLISSTYTYNTNSEANLNLFERKRNPIYVHISTLGILLYVYQFISFTIKSKMTIKTNKEKYFTFHRNIKNVFVLICIRRWVPHKTSIRDLYYRAIYMYIAHSAHNINHPSHILYNFFFCAIFYATQVQ